MNTNTRAIHYDVSSGLSLLTACGRSLHGWADITRAKPIQSTTDPKRVTCARCRKAVAR